MKIAKEKAEQIAYYYLFHKKIELIFQQGENHLYNYLSKNYFTKFFLNSDVNEKQKFYIIDDNWIKNWKYYVNYNCAKKYLDTINVFEYKNEDDYMKEIKERCDNMILTGEISNDSNNLPFIFINDINLFERTFIHKIKLNLEYFDSLIDEKTYELLFKENILISFWKNKKNEHIGLILDKMIALLFKDERKMKFLFSYNNDIIQLTADFNIDNGVKFLNYSSNNAIPIYEEFYYSKLLKEKCDDILKEFINQGILESEYKTIKSNKGENICCLKNDTIFINKYNSNEISKINFNNINIAKFNGLANIGATCYMNATLQNLINIDPLTRYLLNQEIYFKIINDINNYELSLRYCEVLYNLCLIEKNNTYYEPKNFKEIISRKNPLFEGIQANDSKDLINFLLEEMHNELKLLENNKKENFNELFQPNLINNKIFILNNFRKIMNENNKSIISKLFYVLIESVTHCLGCNNDIYNYEVTFYIEFPLENVYNYCLNNNIPTINSEDNKIHIDLIQCFNNYNQPSLFTGENQIYCNTCKCQNNASYINNYYSFPPILIIVLNRGKGNKFKCEVDFPLNLNLKNFCKNYEGNVDYKLQGVISHLGESGMSGHFIAYCRHRINNEWYCYNDAVVSKLNDQINGYKNGTSYILFYQGLNNFNNFLFLDNNNINNNMNMMNNNFNNNFNNNYINQIPNINNMNNNFNFNQNFNTNYFNMNNNINNMNQNLNQNFSCIMNNNNMNMWNNNNGINNNIKYNTYNNNMNNINFNFMNNK